MENNVPYSLLDFINDFYMSRIDVNWTLNEIDKTDLLHWCEISVWKANKDYDAQLRALDKGNY